MSKLNIELLEEVKKHILKNPKHFDMEETLAVLPDCGTVGCIAGTICILRPQDCEREYPGRNWRYFALSPDEQKEGGSRAAWPSVECMAAKLLGITEDEAHELFYVNAWNEDYSDKYYSTKSSKKNGGYNSRIH